MRFSQVIGQQDIKKYLVNLIQQNRLGHALLFLGKDGTGALPLAIALAQYLTCEKAGGKKEPVIKSDQSLFGEINNDSATTGNNALGKKDETILNDACGSCPSCLKMAGLIHPDVHFSYPVIPRKSGDKPVSTDYIGEWRSFVGQYPYGNVYDWLQFIGAENKQGNITALECNDIIRKLNLKSFESIYKILIMWMPEYLGQEGNKLLKLIEEPPDQTLFILVATDESQILPTITSRTQLIKVPVQTRDDIALALVEKTGISKDQAIQIASVSEGNYREALQLVQQAGEDWLLLLREWMNAILRKGPAAQVKWVEEISKLGREKQKQFLRYVNHLLEQAIRIRILTESVQKEQNGETGGLLFQLPDSERDFAIRLNNLSSISQQKAILDELDKSTYYIERNANAKMLFQALTIRISHILVDQMVPVVY